MFNIFTLVAAVLFVLLSPGVLLTIPPVPLVFRSVFLSGRTSLWAAMFHALLYVILLQLITMGVTRLFINFIKNTTITNVATGSITTTSTIAPTISLHQPTALGLPAAAAKKPVIWECDHNCGKYTDFDCLRCKNCGVCTTKKFDDKTGKHVTSTRCLPGNSQGSLFEADCTGSNWKYMTQARKAK